MKKMKAIKKIIVCGALLVAAGCEDGIDPITSVAPGPDEAAPSVVISYPLEGTLFRVKEDVAPINIEFQVTDDIEIGSIEVALNGTTIANLTSFKDYRRALQSYRYEQLTNGSHTLAITATDLSGKTTTETVNFEKVEPYNPVYDGEIFYIPFDGDYLELVNIQAATIVGSPDFSDLSVEGAKSYKGAADAYLTFPTQGLLGDEFSAAFWYKVNASPDRAGILVVGPPEPGVAKPNNRTSGFRLFREDAGGKQRVKLNVGAGAADIWFDGGAAADIDPAAGDWVHIAFTIGADKAVVYINGNIVSEGALPDGVDWAECDLLSIASGAPRFTGWDHFSDQSLIDELRLFDKALTQEEVQTLME